MRIEIWYHVIDGTVYITGTPGPRDWYANLLAHPEFTFHLKDSAAADLPARATPVTGEAQRRAVFARLFPAFGRPRSSRTSGWRGARWCRSPFWSSPARGAAADTGWPWSDCVST